MTAFTTHADTTASPRLFARHKRYARFDRLNYSAQEREFIDKHATRLSRSDSAIFGALKTYTADQIAAAANAAAIGL